MNDFWERLRESLGRIADNGAGLSQMIPLARIWAWLSGLFPLPALLAWLAQIQSLLTTWFRWLFWFHIGVVVLVVSNHILRFFGDGNFLVARWVIFAIICVALIADLLLVILGDPLRFGINRIPGTELRFEIPDAVRALAQLAVWLIVIAYIAVIPAATVATPVFVALLGFALVAALISLSTRRPRGWSWAWVAVGSLTIASMLHVPAVAHPIQNMTDTMNTRDRGQAVVRALRQPVLDEAAENPTFALARETVPYWRNPEDGIFEPFRVREGSLKAGTLVKVVSRTPHIIDGSLHYECRFAALGSLNQQQEFTGYIRGEHLFETPTL
jgi:hypothetical protein